jgi:hypothetical protein
VSAPVFLFAVKLTTFKPNAIAPFMNKEIHWPLVNVCVTNVRV